jgi:nitrile hydratase subunit beta
MNGPHDLGGQDGFGPVAPEQNEPLFHAPWERRALGLSLCSGAMGHWPIDESRHARETIPPATYYAASYYEIWMRGLQKLLTRHGFATPAELASGKPTGAGTTPKRVLKAADVPAALAKGGPTVRAAVGIATFSPGDRVRTRVMHPGTHTRLPRYARGKVGVVDSVHGCHVFPDSNAHGGGEQPTWLYTVAFTGAELWGPEADPTLTVSVEAWEPYLERAPG